MKKYVLSALLLSFAFLISVEQANAQIGRKIRAEIPFEFSVGGKTFEAGKYVFAGINNLSGTKTFQLIDEKNNSLTIIITQPFIATLTSKSDKVSLYFRRYDNQYFLSGISDPVNSLSVEVRKSRKEVLVAKNFRKNKTEISSVILKSGSN